MAVHFVSLMAVTICCISLCARFFSFLWWRVWAVPASHYKQQSLLYWTVGFAIWSKRQWVDLSILSNYNFSWITLATLCIYIVYFSPEMEPVPWTVNAEIFPNWAHSTISNSLATTTYAPWNNSSTCSRHFPFVSGSRRRIKIHPNRDMLCRASRFHDEWVNMNVIETA